ncbi:MAG: hypothetical protein QN191_02095 [Armatimonadota bacterium]|nr:hypothetical protein [Armatimonadota bacterium]MDR7608673.1 hypothetical protein [Armatimonadota bacterium]
MSTKRLARLALLPLLGLLTPFVVAALEEASPAPWTPAPFHTPRPPAPAVFLRINRVYVLYTHPEGPVWHGEPDPLAPPEAGDLYVPVQTTAHLLGLYYSDDPRYTYPPVTRRVTVVHRGTAVEFSTYGVQVFERLPGVPRSFGAPVRPYYVGDRGDMMVPFHTWVSALGIRARFYTNFTIYAGPVGRTRRFRFAVRDYTVPGAIWESPLEGPPGFAVPSDFEDSVDLVPSRFSLTGVVEREAGQPVLRDRLTVTLESLSGRRISIEQVAVHFRYQTFTPGTGWLAGTHMLPSPDQPRQPSPCAIRGATVTCTVSFRPDPNWNYFGGRVRYVLMRVRTRR